MMADLVTLVESWPLWSHLLIGFISGGVTIGALLRR